jgi:hypothetical protein
VRHNLGTHHSYDEGNPLGITDKQAYSPTLRKLDQYQHSLDIEFVLVQDNVSHKTVLRLDIVDGVHYLQTILSHHI